MYRIELANGTVLLGNFIGHDGSVIDSSLEIFRFISSHKHVLITGEDEAMVPAGDIRSFRKLPFKSV